MLQPAHRGTSETLQTIYVRLVGRTVLRVALQLTVGLVMLPTAGLILLVTIPVPAAISVTLATAQRVMPSALSVTRPPLTVLSALSMEQTRRT